MTVFNLEDKVVVITGAGSGIGKAIATVLEKSGAIIHGFDIKDAKYKVDVSVQSEVDKVIADIGRIDILVNSAGIAHIGNLENTSEADIDRIYNVNVKGTYNMMHAVIPIMKKQKKGVILNMASVAGTVGIPDRFAYSMSKGAVISMTLSVAKDYIRDGIRCNCISPGRVHTPFVDGFIKANYPGKEQEMFEKLSKTQPIGRMATPDEIAYLALYLCSDEAGFITGTDYPIDGGFIKLNN
jgi:NAD(P)-dependent dehydrogenase (short-subunit alcohol dehydrogenase family)